MHPARQVENIRWRNSFSKRIWYQACTSYTPPSRRTKLRCLRVVEDRYHTLSTKGMLHTLSPSNLVLFYIKLLTAPPQRFLVCARYNLGRDMDAALYILDVIIQADGCNFRLSAGHIFCARIEQVHRNLVRFSNCMYSFVEITSGLNLKLYIMDSGGAMLIRNPLWQHCSHDLCWLHGTWERKFKPRYSVLGYLLPRRRAQRARSFSSTVVNANSVNG